MSPAAWPRSNNALFCLNEGLPNRVYLMNPTTGSVTASWPTPRSLGNLGLAYTSGANLYVGCVGNDTIYRCYAGNGSVVASWELGHEPYGLAPVQTGDGGVGARSLYCSDSNPSYFWRHDYISGSVTSSFPAPHSSRSDIAYDHRNVLIWRYNTDGAVYGINTSGSVMASFSWSGYGDFNGMAYCDEFLFIAGDIEDHIYRVHCPDDVGVRPASMGKVKALFR
jgi:hypothetical protein